MTLFQRPDEWIDLLVNDIGSQSGETRFYAPGVYYLEIVATSYRVEIQVFK